jgi:phosphoribosylaminoimidazole-succinocarboxamide synthase
MTHGRKIAEGKTKIIWEGGEVLIESKDDITAGDVAKHDLLEGKAVTATATTCNVFELLEAAGVKTHYRGRVDERTFRARRMRMIPLELVARRIATGSYLKRRPDVTEGTIFKQPVIEFFEKDDAHHDPLLIFDLPSRRVLRYVASKPLDEGFFNEQSLDETPFADMTGTQMMELMQVTEQVFMVLEDAWAKLEVALVDLKIECGMDALTGELMVADVVDNDSWRIWPGGDKAQMKDKQVYRDLAGVGDAAAKAKELGKIKQNYAWVADATGKFTAGTPDFTKAAVGV